jgi:DNA-binding CsgD family transcriptional regulator
MKAMTHTRLILIKYIALIALSMLSFNCFKLLGSFSNSEIELLAISFFISGFSFFYFYNKGVTKVNSMQVNLLSLREKEILTLLGEFKTNKEIANYLNIETATVKCHINNLYKKLKITNRKEALETAKFMNERGIV